MKDELDKALCEKYPLIFKDRQGDMKDTAMFWGFEHGDGWYQILDSLCGNIQSYIDWNNRSAVAGYKDFQPVEQVVAQQVKEKFGGLRFYYQGGDRHISGMVRMAESWASVTCEVCGAPGTIRHGGWIKTLCDAHHEEREEKRNAIMKQTGLED